MESAETILGCRDDRNPEALEHICRQFVKGANVPIQNYFRQHCPQLDNLSIEDIYQHASYVHDSQQKEQKHSREVDSEKDREIADLKRQLKEARKEKEMEEFKNLAIKTGRSMSRCRQSRNYRSNRMITCYLCGKPGHMVKVCKYKKQINFNRPYNNNNRSNNRDRDDRNSYKAK